MSAIASKSIYNMQNRPNNTPFKVTALQGRLFFTIFYWNNTLQQVQGCELMLFFTSIFYFWNYIFHKTWFVLVCALMCSCHLKWQCDLGIVVLALSQHSQCSRQRKVDPCKLKVSQSYRRFCCKQTNKGKGQKTKQNRTKHNVDNVIYRLFLSFQV